MAQNDYYKTLGITKTASQADVKSAFKKLAKKYHPDLNPDNKAAEEKFKKISEAYEVLGDEKKRKQFDQYGAFNFGSGGPRNPYSQEYWKSNNNINDIDLEDIFGDIFGFGGPKRGRRSSRSSFNYGDNFKQQRSRNGSNINWSLKIDFLDAVNGCDKQILLSDGNKVKVKIPEGVDTGSKIRLAGKGNPGVAGGKAGDLIIETKVNSHAYFKREKNNIHIDMDISLSEAINGASVQVPTLTGKVQLKIPAGTQSGQQLRLKGKGVKNLKSKKHGDLYIHLLVKYPEKLSEQEKEDLSKILNNHSIIDRVW
ncbi:hypothetical protein BVY03_03775 [bacterium K02(2017)]|nr:hypothetical protein BVY03_03775 [bacterium K02(2017)]